jgi:hypothetical protein
MPAGVVVLQLGLGVAALGLLAVLRPLAWLWLSTRQGGGALFAAGLLLTIAGALLPAPDRRAGPRRRIDDFLPAYQFNEVHTAMVEAPPERVRAALLAVTLEDIRFASTLLAIRSLGRRRAPAEARRPILDVATSGSFLWLAQDDRELVVGSVGRFWQLRGSEPSGIRTAEEFTAFGRPGWAKAAMDFVIVPAGVGRTRITTETRVAATDPAARRTFAAYWRLIYPGSALLRRMWLQAIKRRAESVPGPPTADGGYHGRRGGQAQRPLGKTEAGPVVPEGLRR